MHEDDQPVVCAWCNAAVSSSNSTEQLSHGICVPCAIRLLKRLPPEYLKSIAGPDGSVTLVSGHRFEVPAPGDVTP
jgi:hypothetical protein